MPFRRSTLRSPVVLGWGAFCLSVFVLSFVR